jgi:glycosyltransferase involved in cell wall biosynthesis
MSSTVLICESEEPTANNTQQQPVSVELAESEMKATMATQFRIHSLCVVKNEADVIAHCLREASRWSDRIYVLDNGSTDGTWEIVRSCANSQIIPWKQDQCRFREGLRADLFNAFRHDAAPGDWWCRLDADEFYADDPRQFLADVGGLEHVVWAVAIEYYLTDRDVESLDFGEAIDQLLQRLQFYSASKSEARFFRHRRRLVWDGNCAWPRHMGLVHSRRIRYRHYKYRTPEQVQRRLDTRRKVIEQGGDFWWADQAPDWRQAVVKADALCRDDGSGQFMIDENLLPRHLESPVRRLAKTVLNACGLLP